MIGDRLRADRRRQAPPQDGRRPTEAEARGCCFALASAADFPCLPCGDGGSGGHGRDERWGGGKVDGGGGGGDCEGVNDIAPAATPAAAAGAAPARGDVDGKAAVEPGQRRRPNWELRGQHRLCACCGQTRGDHAEHVQVCARAIECARDGWEPEIASACCPV